MSGPQRCATNLDGVSPTPRLERRRRRLGHLHPVQDHRPAPERLPRRSNSASALSVEMTLKAHQTETVRFVLAWDFPQITFGTAGDTTWMRRYTSFYGAREDAKNNYITGSYPGHQGFAIAARNLLRADKSAKDVARWWKPVAAEHDGVTSDPDGRPERARSTPVQRLLLGIRPGFKSPPAGSTTGRFGGPRHAPVPHTHRRWLGRRRRNPTSRGRWRSRCGSCSPLIEADWVRATSEMIADRPEWPSPRQPRLQPPRRRLHLVAAAGTVAAVGDLDQPRRSREPPSSTGRPST